MSSFGILRQDWKPGALAVDSSVFSGLKVAIFGGTGGLGRAISQSLLSKGAKVTVIGRSLKDAAHHHRVFVPADLSSLVNARSVARDLAVETWDALLLTHGIFAGRSRAVTSEGLEKDLATSALSRWAIVREMAPRLSQGTFPGRVKPRLFVWGFPGGERSLNFADVESSQNYRWQTAHSNTVVFNEALVLDMASRFPDINIFGMNPGIIKTDIMSGVLGQSSLTQRIQQMLVGLLFQSAETYAEKVTPLLVDRALEDRSGSLFNRNAQPIEPNPWLEADDHLARVVEAAEALSARVLG
jgi:NAD(P)-dependent dehydrogenase (short-subunit alcohol dehydrogenase family)